MCRVIVTNWEKVEKDDFYLSSDWKEDNENQKKAKKLQKRGELYIAYSVSSLDLVLYTQMDAIKIFIDYQKNTIMQCENAVISDEYKDIWELDY